MLVVNDRIQVPKSEFTFSFARSGGPGGQNVNKLNTKATLQWDVTATCSLPGDVRRRFLACFRRRLTKDGRLLVTSERYRHQERNVQDCLEKLRQMILQVATPPKRRIPTRRPRAANERRLRDKRSLAQKKEMRRPPP